jgi:8-oxo-dGTP diphosphatase
MDAPGDPEASQAARTVGRSMFAGCKLALLHGNRVLVYRRDQKAGIAYPGMLDLPGGAREGDESPEECVLRELHEEFGIRLPDERLLYRGSYPIPDSEFLAWFFVGELYAHEIEDIVFGSEGAYWMLMGSEEFIAHPDGIPHLRALLRDFLRADATRVDAPAQNRGGERS